MRKYGRILAIGLALIAAGLLLTGCGRRGFLERAAGGEPETVTIDLVPTQATNAMSAPDSGTADQTNATAPVATPKASAQAGKTDTSNADLSALMDSLDDALDELEASIYAADQDTLTDATLTALGK